MTERTSPDTRACAVGRRGAYRISARWALAHKWFGSSDNARENAARASFG